MLPKNASFNGCKRNKKGRKWEASSTKGEAQWMMPSRVDVDRPELASGMVLPH